MRKTTISAKISIFNQIAYKTVPLTTATQPDSAIRVDDKLILFGEDDPDDEELLKEVFASVDEKFSLLFVSTGKKLISTLETMPSDQLPCLIVLDYKMPELNGAEILEALRHRQLCDSIPKVVWSTSGSEKFRSSCLELGAEEYFIKPSTLSGLTEIARRMLAFC